MHNLGLAADYVRRAGVRLRALDVLFEGESWADVVRESQEIVELALKGLLRAASTLPGFTTCRKCSSAKASAADCPSLSSPIWTSWREPPSSSAEIESSPSTAPRTLRPRISTAATTR